MHMVSTFGSDVPLYTRKNFTTCRQDVFATGLQQACQQVVTMLLFYQVATSLSLTTCWQIVELQDDNKLLEQVCWTQQPCSKLSTSRWQLVNELGTSSANTSCWQVVGTALLQVRCRFVVRFYVCTFIIREWVPVSCLKLSHANCLQLELYCVKHTTHLQQRR
jgi:hypothetical protein